jgi:hypothetical protein
VFDLKPLALGFWLTLLPLFGRSNGQGVAWLNAGRIVEPWDIRL